MKRLTFLICLLLSVVTNAQTPLIFESVVSADSISKSDLFNNGKSWVVATFRDAKEVIQLEDKDAGRITCKGVFEYKAPQWWGGGTANANGYVRFTIKLYFKEGRYKYSFSEFNHEPIDGISFGIITDSDKPPMKSHMGSKKRAQIIWDDLIEKTRNNTELLIESLKTKMEDKEDDW